MLYVMKNNTEKKDISIHLEEIMNWKDEQRSSIHLDFIFDEKVENFLLEIWI